MSKRNAQQLKRFKNRWHWKYKRHVFHPVDWSNPESWKKEAQIMANREMVDSELLGFYSRNDRRNRWRLSVSKTRVHWNRYLLLKKKELT